MFIDAVVFFNPFLKNFNNAVNTQRELSCDDAVLAHNYSPNLYAEALLNVAKSQIQYNQLIGSMTAVNDNQQQLKHRIKRILNIDDDNFKNKFCYCKQMAFSLLFGVVLFILIGFINVDVNEVMRRSLYS
jgi:beta-lactamase regulating signal transducer with metallopeptidase domain